MDLIDREAAIDACLIGKTDGLPATNVACDCCAERIRVLPSAQPERKTGTWVSVGCVVPSIANVPMIKCTVCGHLEPDVDAARTPYCSHCGSRMKEG